MSVLPQLIHKDNKIFTQAKQGRRLPNFLVAILALLVIMIGTFVPLSIAAESIYGNVEALEELWGGAFFLIGPFLVMIGLLGLWVRLFERRPYSTAGFLTNHFFRNYFFGFAIGFVMLATTIGLMSLTGSLEFETATVQPSSVNLILGVLLMLLGFIVQGGAEEILIHGWLFQVMGARYTPWVGLIVSTILFTAFHGSTSIMANLNLILFSIFLTFYYLYEGSIFGAMGWHSAWNWAQSNVFGVKLSGSIESEHTLMNMRTTGSQLLSGGDFGPEASLLCTLVFLIGLVMMMMLSKYKKVAK